MFHRFGTQRPASSLSPTSLRAPGGHLVAPESTLARTGEAKLPYGNLTCVIGMVSQKGGRLTGRQLYRQFGVNPEADKERPSTTFRAKALCELRKVLKARAGLDQGRPPSSCRFQWKTACGVIASGAGFPMCSPALLSMPRASARFRSRRCVRFAVTGSVLRDRGPPPAEHPARAD